MAQKRVIFVHGMGPKPPKEQYWEQWRGALRRSLWVELPDEATAMAYWADLRYRQAVPQVPGNLLDWFKRRLIKALWRDVYLLFYTEVGEAIRQRLRKELTAAAGQRIAIIAHSLGSVIAYDVLRRHLDIKVDLLVTLGSPLGLNQIRYELRRLGGDTVFPAHLHRWLNLFDGMDPVTLPDQRLIDEYTLNGGHLVIDRMIRENYSPEGKRDAHHWFGYLTCWEVGDAISQFLIAP